MEEGEIEAEGGNAYRLLIDVHSGDLVAEDFAELRFADTLSILLSEQMTDNPAERFDKEDSRATRRVDHAWAFRKHFRRKCPREDEFDEGGRGIMRPLISLFSFAFVVKFLINRADEFDRYHVESVGEEKQLSLL